MYSWSLHVSYRCREHVSDKRTGQIAKLLLTTFTRLTESAFGLEKLLHLKVIQRSTVSYFMTHTTWNLVTSCSTIQLCNLAIPFPIKSNTRAVYLQVQVKAVLAMSAKTIILISLLSAVHPQSSGSEEHLSPLYVLVLSSNCNRDAQQPGQPNPAALAAQLVNNRSDLLKGYKLKVIRKDTDCTRYSDVAAFISAIIDEQRSPVVGVIGPTQSPSGSSAERIATLVSRRELALLHIHVASSFRFLSRNLSPFSYSMLDSPNVLLMSSLALIRQRSWKRVKVLYRSLHDKRLPFDFTGLTHGLEDMNVKYSISELSVDFHFDIRYQLHLLFVDHSLVYPVLCAFFHSKLAFPTYQFLFVLRSPSGQPLTPLTAYTGVDMSCTARQMAVAAKGALILQYQTQPINSAQQSSLSGLTYSQIQNSPYSNAPLTFDAVWSLALAMNNSMAIIEEQLNETLADYTYGNLNATAIISQQLQKLNFAGTSGDVDLRGSEGYTIRDVTIHQFLGDLDTLTLVATYFTEQDSLNVNSSQFQATVTDFSVHCPFTIVTPPKFIAITSYIISIIMLFGVLIINALTLYYRKRKSVKASSYKLAQLTFIGCYSFIFAVITHTSLLGYMDVILPMTVCRLWHVVTAFISLGTTLISGSLCVRTWRLYRIFIHFRKPGKFLSDKILITGVLLCVCFDLVVSVIYGLIESNAPRCSRDDRIVRCRQRYFIYLLILLTVFNSAFMVMCLIFTALTRSRYNTDFNVRNTLRGVFLSSAVTAIGLPLYTIFLYEASVHSVIVVFNVGFFLTVSIISIFITLPPLLPIFKEYRDTNLPHHRQNSN